MDESYFGGREKGNRGRELPEDPCVQNVSGQTFLPMTIKEVKPGNFIYTDKFRSYNGLISYGFRQMKIDHGKRFVNGKVYINGIEGFWSFAKERLRNIME